MFLGYNLFMNILEEFDTIAAPATPMGAGGVGVIRISGDKAFEIIEKIFSNPKFEPRKFNHGWILDGSKKFEDFPGGMLSAGLFALTAGMLLLQPDVGMTIVVSLIWGFQLFLAGLPIVLVAVLGLIAVAGAVGAYFTFDHVHDRVQQFLASGDNLGYQVRKSLEAFESGNLLGRGPGEGIVKLNLPDAHTDFIFAVAGEEFGIWLCIILVMLFGVIVIRSLWLSLKDNNLFIVYASAGLAASFGLQGIINMASTLHLMPTKGMTLPFISYGGSSLFASAVTIGMLLAITRKNSSAEDKDDPF